MNLHPETTRTIGGESVRTITAIVAAIISMSLDKWVQVATLCAILLSGGYTAWKWHREWRRAKRQDMAEKDDAA